MSAKYDSDYARGNRGPHPVPGRGAWLNILDIRKAGLMLEKKIEAILLESPEKEHCLRDLDRTLVFAESVVLRYDRNGPPESQSEIGDMEATLRLAIKYPDHFKSFDLEGLKRETAALRKKVG